MRTLVSAALAAASLAVTGVGQAHHSGSVYDSQHPIELQGVITSIDWVNPHVLMHFMVKSPDGKATEWTVESDPPAGLRKWGLTKRRVEEAMGIDMKVYISPARGGAKLGFLNGIDFADGGQVRIGAKPPTNDGK